jgi:hypothetical protein
MATTLPIKVEVAATDKASQQIRKTLGRIGKAARAFSAGTGKKVAAFGAAAKTASDGIGKVGATALKFGAAAAAAGVAAGIAAGKMLTAWAANADEFAKFSRQVGVSVESLQELRFASERQGVGADVLNKSLEKMSLLIGQAKSGQGALNTYLKKTNPSLLKQVKAARSNEEAFDVLAGAIAGIEDPNRRAALAVAAFGKSGAKMTRLVDGGTEALAALRAEQRKNGVITTKAANDAEAFNDRITDLKASLAGIFHVIAARVIPILTPLIARTREWVLANKDLIAGKLEAAVRGIVDAFGKAYRWIQDNKAALSDLASTSFDALKASVTWLKDNWEDVRSAVEILATVWIAGKLFGAIEGLKNAFKIVATSPHYLAVFGTIIAAKKMADAFDKSGKDWIKSYARESKGVRTFDDPEKAADYARKEGERLAAAADAARASREAIRDATDNLTGPDLPYYIGGRPASFGGTETGRVYVPRIAKAATRAEVGGEVRLKFDNPPAGLRVEDVRSTNPNVPLRADVGRSRVGMVAP